MKKIIKVQEIMGLAIEITHMGIAHVFVDYSGHVDSLHVFITSSKTRYNKKGWDRQFDLSLYFKRESSTIKLDFIIKHLRDLKMSPLKEKKENHDTPKPQQVGKQGRQKPKP